VFFCQADETVRADRSLPVQPHRGPAQPPSALRISDLITREIPLLDVVDLVPILSATRSMVSATSSMIFSRMLRRIDAMAAFEHPTVASTAHSACDGR